MYDGEELLQSAILEYNSPDTQQLWNTTVIERETLKYNRGTKQSWNTILVERGLCGAKHTLNTTPMEVYTHKTQQAWNAIPMERNSRRTQRHPLALTKTKNNSGRLANESSLY